MSAKERLQVVQSALEERGVRDVKFCFAKGVSETGGQEVAKKVANFMEAFLGGKRVKMSIENEAAAA